MTIAISGYMKRTGTRHATTDRILSHKKYMCTEVHVQNMCTDLELLAEFQAIPDISSGGGAIPQKLSRGTRPPSPRVRRLFT